MELKKTKKADLRNKRALFLELGLAVSLLMAIGLFVWGNSEKKVDKMEAAYVPESYELPPVTIPDEKPRIMTKVFVPVADVMRIVDNDKQINTNMEFPEDFPDIVIPRVKTKETATDDDNKIFMIVEQYPSFQGGDLNEFRRWVQSKLSYPGIAAENGIEGKVTLSFVVEKDGTITNIEIIQSPDRSLGEEAARVLKMSPKWEAGRQRNVPVRVKYVLPVEFRLG